MTLPVRHRPGSLLERLFPGFGWGEPVAAEFEELFERMNRLLQGTRADHTCSGRTRRGKAGERQRPCDIQQPPGRRWEGGAQRWHGCSSTVMTWSYTCRGGKGQPPAAVTCACR